ncbi:MAG: hypothetical protein GY847_28850 [Proteobacteria bacterium]|nr:hypothetical protein [Pseudomonadota bacterium]
MTTSVITGENLRGEKRIYTFQLMDTETGLRIYHENSEAFLQLANILAANTDADEKVDTDTDTRFEEMERIHIYSMIFPWDKVTELTAAMLTGLVVEIDSKRIATKDGFGDFAAGDPGEHYSALTYAIQANYVKVLGPLMARPDNSRANDVTRPGIPANVNR